MHYTLEFCLILIQSMWLLFASFIEVLCISFLGLQSKNSYILEFNNKVVWNNKDKIK